MLGLEPDGAVLRCDAHLPERIRRLELFRVPGRWGVADAGVDVTGQVLVDLPAGSRPWPVVQEILFAARQISPASTLGEHASIGFDLSEAGRYRLVADDGRLSLDARADEADCVLATDRTDARRVAARRPQPHHDDLLRPGPAHRRRPARDPIAGLPVAAGGRPAMRGVTAGRPTRRMPGRAPGEGRALAAGMVTVLLVAAALFCWGALSARLERADLTAPIVFVAVGLLLSFLVPLTSHVDAEALTVLTEVTLVWVLFSDAARVSLADLRADAGVYGRLLGLALPVTVLLGWGLASALFGGLFGAASLWLALFVGAALAPTDAALSAAVLNNPHVPARVRGIVNVESGLNDGIVTPVVLIALAGAASGEGGTGLGTRCSSCSSGSWPAPGWGRPAAAAAGCPPAAAGWTRTSAGIAVLALALAAYAAALVSGGNGFVAAFAAGTAFGAAAGTGRHPEGVAYVEQTAGLAGLLVWTFFGAVALPRVVDAGAWQLALYAVLSLTAVRMIPVAGGPDRLRPQPGHRPVHRLVRPEGAGVGRVRPARAGGARRRARTGRGRRRRHGAR